MYRALGCGGCRRQFRPFGCGTAHRPFPTVSLGGARFQPRDSKDGRCDVADCRNVARNGNTSDPQKLSIVHCQLGYNCQLFSPSVKQTALIPKTAAVPVTMAGELRLFAFYNSISRKSFSRKNASIVSFPAESFPCWKLGLPPPRPWRAAVSSLLRLRRSPPGRDRQ